MSVNKIILRPLLLGLSTHTHDSLNVSPYHCTQSSPEVASSAPSYLPHSGVGVWTVSREKHSIVTKAVLTLTKKRKT